MPIWLIVLIISLSAFVVTFIIWFFINGTIFFNVTFRRREGDADFAKNEDPRAKKAPDRIWFFDQKLEELTLVSYDKLNLKGYFLNNNSNKLAILVHGYHGRYYSVVSQARIFYENGYDVLCINNRCHDTSEGKSFSMGKKEARDVIDWINKMLERNPNYQIALYGISMGAHIAMRAATDKKLSPNVKCVIEDCGYSHLRKQLHYIMSSRNYFAGKWIVNVAELYTKLIYHFSYGHPIEKRAKNLHIPILMFHGGKDNYVPTENLNKISKSIPENIYQEKYIFEKSGHTACVIDNKEEYKKMLTSFVNKFIK